MPLVYLVMHMWVCHDLPGEPFGEVGVAGECGIRVAAAIMTAFFAYALGDGARPADAAGPCGRVLYGEPADGHGVVRIGGSVLAVL